MYCIWEYVTKAVVQIVPSVIITLALTSRIFLIKWIIFFWTRLKFTSSLPFTFREWSEATDCQKTRFSHSKISKITVFRHQICTEILIMVQACTTAIVLLYCIWDLKTQIVRLYVVQLLYYLVPTGALDHMTPKWMDQSWSYNSGTVANPGRPEGCNANISFI